MNTALVSFAYLHGGVSDS